MGLYKPSKKDFGIVTNKPVKGLIGETVWLLTGAGRPRNYYLVSRFVVDKTGHLDIGRFRNFASGIEGQDFTPPIEIGGMDWFPELLKTCGRFSLGLLAIKSDIIIKGFQKVSSI